MNETLGMTPTSPEQKESRNSVGYNNTNQDSGKPVDAESSVAITPASETSKPRKSPRAKKGERLTIQLGARVSTQMFGWLLRIAEFEGFEYTEVTRLALRDLITQYRRDPFFQEWMKTRESKQ